MKRGTQHNKPHHVIKEPLLTEKYAPYAAGKKQKQCVAFKVSNEATKQDIRTAVEALYNDVTVDSVRTMKVKGKPRRTRQGWFRTRDWKKAVVVLSEGQTLDLV